MKRLVSTFPRIALILLLAVSAIFAAPTNDGASASKGVVGTAQLKSPTIVGGDFVPSNNPIKYQVWLSVTFGNSSYACGGSIISRQWVLTAAHCVSNGSTLVKASNIVVYSGSNFRSTAATSSVSKVIRHKSYDPQKVVNDLALIKLGTPLSFDDTRGAVSLPMDLPESWPEAGTNVLVSGWGIQSLVNQTIPNQIKSANITVLSSPGSKANCGWWSILNMYNPTQNLCAGSNDGSDICQGDSGGPYMVTTDGIQYLAGVTSFNAGTEYCGDPNYPGQAVRVTSFINWIVPSEPTRLSWSSKKSTYKVRWNKVASSSAPTIGYLVQMSTDGGTNFNAGSLVKKPNVKIICSAGALCDFRVAAVSEVNQAYGPYNFAD